MREVAIKTHDPEGYLAFRDLNSNDGYSFGVVTYLERWAQLMEAHIEGGVSVADAAEVTEHEADTEGITGFMYGCAVVALRDFWIHGPELYQWHKSRWPS